MKFWYLFFLFLSFSVKSQTISGLVTDEAGNPLAGVSVFFDNSTTAASTKQDGTFSIQIPENNQSSLIFSVFGYKYSIIEKPKAQQNLRVVLKMEDNELVEMVIDAAIFSRKEYLKAFRHFFLGSTPNAKKSKINNEEVLSFFYDKTTNTFYAYADQPIKVRNKNLAYEIHCHLDMFEVQYRTLSLEPSMYSSSNFLGYMHYQDKSEGRKKVVKNRQETYDQASMTFLKELVNNEVNEGNFFLAVNGLSVEPEEYFDIQKEPDGYRLTLKKKPTQKKRVYSLKEAFASGVFNPNQIPSEYEEVEVPFVVLNAKTRQQSQLYFQSEEIKIDKNGNLKNPNEVFFSGYFSELRIADMLPLDYIGVKRPTKKSSEASTNKKMPTYEVFEKEAIAFYTSKNYNAHRKARKSFFDKLKVEYDYKVHEPFALWIDEHLKSTLFVSKEEAITLYDDFVSTFKLIKDQKEDIERKEDYFSKLYGEEKFGKMYYNKVIQGLLNKLMNAEEEN